MHGAGRPLVGASMVTSHDRLFHAFDWDNTTDNNNDNIMFILYSIFSQCLGILKIINLKVANSITTNKQFLLILFFQLPHHQFRINVSGTEHEHMTVTTAIP